MHKTVRPPLTTGGTSRTESIQTELETPCVLAAAVVSSVEVVTLEPLLCLQVLLAVSGGPSSCSMLSQVQEV